jgi:hypothetical protein
MQKIYRRKIFAPHRCSSVAPCGSDYKFPIQKQKIPKYPRVWKKKKHLKALITTLSLLFIQPLWSNSLTSKAAD